MITERVFHLPSSKNYYKVLAYSQSLVPLSLAGLTRILIAFSPQSIGRKFEIILAVALISLGSVHGSVDAGKLMSLSNLLRFPKAARAFMGYLLLVLAGVSVFVAETKVGTVLFISIAIIHFAVVDAVSRSKAGGGRGRSIAALLTVLMVFALTFKSSNSLASQYLVDLIGSGQNSGNSFTALAILALAFGLLLLGWEIFNKVPKKVIGRDLALVATLVISPSLIGFAIFYAFRHSVDQWLEDQEQLGAFALDLRTVAVVIIVTAGILALLMVHSRPLIAFIALGFGLTLAHMTLDIVDKKVHQTSQSLGRTSQWQC